MTRYVCLIVKRTQHLGCRVTKAVNLQDFFCHSFSQDTKSRPGNEVISFPWCDTASRVTYTSFASENLGTPVLPILGRI